MEGFEGIRSIQAWTPIDPADAPRSAKALHARMLAKGWDAQIQHAVTLVKATHYAASSATNNKGDVKKPAHGVDHFAVTGKLDAQGQQVGRLLAVWAAERPAEGAKAKPVTFDHAHTWDMVTEEIEFHRTVSAFEEWAGILAPKPPARKKPDAKALPIRQDVDQELVTELARGVWHA